MPRGGGPKVSTEELRLLTKWIDEGAKFDGADPTTQLMALVPNAPKGKVPVMTGPKLEVVAATGKESIPVRARDIAPVLVRKLPRLPRRANSPGGQLADGNFRDASQRGR